MFQTTNQISHHHPQEISVFSLSRHTIFTGPAALHRMPVEQAAKSHRVDQKSPTRQHFVDPHVTWSLMGMRNLSGNFSLA